MAARCLSRCLHFGSKEQYMFSVVIQPSISSAACQKYYGTKTSGDTQYEEEENIIIGKLYADHIPSTLFQKVLLSIGSAAIAISDPFRDDMVAVLGETTGYLSAKKIHHKMSSDPEGCEILRDMPRINSTTVSMDYLKSLPRNTFGQEYLSFLERNGVSPDTRQPVHFVDNAELAYVIQRYREVHDLLHTVLGMPTNMLGEVTVKWIEAIQTGLPMCYAGALFGPLRFKPKQRQRYVTTFLPWALECGFKAKFLLNVYFEKRWEQTIDDLRQELKIKAPPLIM